MQHVADGVLVLDRQSQVRLANPAALLLLGREAPAAQVCARFTRCQELASAHIDIGPGQTRELHLWEATP
jgi:PAS domain-containing protein